MRLDLEETDASRIGDKMKLNADRIGVTCGNYNSPQLEFQQRGKDLSGG